MLRSTDVNTAPDLGQVAARVWLSGDVEAEGLRYRTSEYFRAFSQAAANLTRMHSFACWYCRG